MDEGTASEEGKDVPGEQQAESTEKVGVWPPLSFPHVPVLLVTADPGLTKPQEKHHTAFKRRLCAPGKGCLPGAGVSRGQDSAGPHSPLAV